MSHHQDLNIVLWVERGEVLGELLQDLRSSAAVLSTADCVEQGESSLETKVV